MTFPCACHFCHTVFERTIRGVSRSMTYVFRRCKVRYLLSIPNSVFACSVLSQSSHAPQSPPSMNNDLQCTSSSAPLSTASTLARFWYENVLTLTWIGALATCEPTVRSHIPARSSQSELPLAYGVCILDILVSTKGTASRLDVTQKEHGYYLSSTGNGYRRS